MTEAPPGLVEELQKIWDALVADLAVPPVGFVLQRGTIRGFLEGDLFAVPETHATHFERFGTVPTSLIRDAAYAAKKRQLASAGERGASMEADALAYAEVFLRAAMARGED